ARLPCPQAMRCALPAGPGMPRRENQPSWKPPEGRNAPISQGTPGAGGKLGTGKPGPARTHPDSFAAPPFPSGERQNVSPAHTAIGGERLPPPPPQTFPDPQTSPSVFGQGPPRRLLRRRGGDRFRQNRGSFPQRKRNTEEGPGCPPG